MKHEIALLIRKFLLGKTTKEEQEKLGNWYNNTGQHVVPQRPEPWPLVKKRIWQQIRRQAKPEYKRRQLPGWMIPSAAAAILVVLVLSWNWFTQHHKIQEYQVATKAGEMKKFRLDDGTFVWLNAGSSLRYTSEYGQKYRKVALDGEALFDVMHNPDRPFVVQTKASVTRVLGTRFTVRAYTGEQQQVALTRGKVEVSFPLTPKTPACMLTPGEMISFSSDDGEIARRHIQPEKAEGWTKQVLYFDARPLSEVFATLERTYGVSIRITDRVDPGRKYTASFNKAELSQILRSISRSMALSFKPVGNNMIEITGK